jgi:hypothetical protein
MTGIIRIERSGILYALAVRRTFNPSGVHFITDPDSSQQVALMRHKEQTVIKPHFHNSIARVITKTQEVLFVKNGKLLCDLYDNEQCYIESCLLEAGDLIILLDGGHGFNIIEDAELIEVKQGPYVKSADKTHFCPVRP